MEAIPVIVIHGVNVRNQKEFENDVAMMNRNVGKEWKFIPVYWGGDAAVVDYVKVVIPQIGLKVRAEEDAHLESLIATLLTGSMPGGAEVRSPDAAADIVANAAAERTMVRSMDEEEIRRTIREEWGNQNWLVLVQDEETLQKLGRAVADAVAQDQDEARPDVRGFSIAKIVKRILGVLNNGVGAIITLTAGNFHQYLRGSLSPVFGRFLGDVFVYESKRDKIQALLRKAVKDLGGGWGTAQKPISVLAHSLGGVITFDSTVRPDDPLYVDRFVTFGSQPGFFHVINRRYQVALFQGKRIRLGVTIRRWLNVWQPLDPLAFLTWPVFELADSQFPKDIMLPHRGSDPLWTHSVYWSSSRFADEVRSFLK